MKKNIVFVIVFILISSFIINNPAQSQRRELSLYDAVNIAKDQSLRAFIAKHRFRASYWNFKSFQASYRPYVSAEATPFNLNRSISKNNVLENGQWVEKYAETSSLNSSVGLNIMQQVPWTGGSIFMRSNLNRIDLLNGDPASFMTTPISVGFNQPLFSFNEFNWERKIAPMEYEISKKNYIEDMEDVASNTVQRFFELVGAQERWGRNPGDKF